MTNQMREKYSMEGKFLNEGLNKQNNPIYYCLVSFQFDNIRMTIANMPVKKSNKPGKTWWVQMPGYSGRNRNWHYFVEVDSDKFFQACEEICIEATQNYLLEKHQDLPSQLDDIKKPPKAVANDPLADPV